MSAAQRIASAFNECTRHSLDVMGGVDGDALERLIDDYYDYEEGSGAVPGCKQ